MNGVGWEHARAARARQKARGAAPALSPGLARPVIIGLGLGVAAFLVLRFGLSLV